MSARRLRIGVDLGGSKIEAAALDREGRIIFRKRRPTPPHDYDATLQAIRALVDEAAAGDAEASVGIGIPGAVSPATGLVKNANSTWLNGRPLTLDLERLAALVRQRGILLAVDNSLLSPCLQQPLALGAHLVVHSATKALCGHGDVLAGAVVTDEPELHERIAFHLNAEGAGLAPFDSWLLLRGMKTLALRMERQNATARKIAECLVAHPDTRQVFYPGLGPVVSFTTGDPELSRRLVEAARLFTIAVSFGSVASSISLPCHMSHASVPAELRDRLAPPPDLVRLSVGIEDPEDLLDDLRQAFAAAAIEPSDVAKPQKVCRDWMVRFRG